MRALHFLWFVIKLKSLSNVLGLNMTSIQNVACEYFNSKALTFQCLVIETWGRFDIARTHTTRSRCEVPSKATAKMRSACSPNKCNILRSTTIQIQVGRRWQLPSKSTTEATILAYKFWSRTQCKWTKQLVGGNTLQKIHQHTASSHEYLFRIMVTKFGHFLRRVTCSRWR